MTQHRSDAVAVETDAFAGPMRPSRERTWSAICGQTCCTDVELDAELAGEVADGSHRCRRLPDAVESSQCPAGRAHLRLRSRWLEPVFGRARSRPHDVREKRLAGQRLGQAEIQRGGVAERPRKADPAGRGARSKEAVYALARCLVRIDLAVHLAGRPPRR